MHVCIFVNFDNIVDKPQQFIEGDNKGIGVIILIIKKRYIVSQYGAIVASLGDDVWVATTDKVHFGQTPLYTDRPPATNSYAEHVKSSQYAKYKVYVAPCLYTLITILNIAYTNVTWTDISHTYPKRANKIVGPAIAEHD